MSHYTRLATGQHVNHNGNWGGELDFGKPVLLIDCLDCLVSYLEDRMVQRLEEYGATGSRLGVLQSDLDALRALDNIRAFLDDHRGKVDL